MSDYWEVFDSHTDALIKAHALADGEHNIGVYYGKYTDKPAVLSVKAGTELPKTIDDSFVFVIGVLRESTFDSTKAQFYKNLVDVVKKIADEKT